MSPLKFFVCFGLGWIGLSFLLSFAIGKILRWVDSEPKANEPRA
jgi:hypothetical protein